MKHKKVILIAAVLIVTVTCVAQRFGGGGRWRQYTNAKTIREARPDYNAPTWTNRAGFENDVFTFARIRYDSDYSSGRRGGGWMTDVPEADMNLAFRLQQMTSLKVNPDGRIVRLTDPELYDYPFVYIVEPGALEFSEEEVAALRRYLLSGGFLMVDDFWGVREGDNLYEQMKRVFPERDAVVMPLEHPIFHCVFDLKIKPQIPGIRVWESTGLTYERYDAQEVDYRGIFDDKGRLMVMICHNTDTGDGWEEEGTSPEYFKQFSEKYAYPLGINIIFYAMTH